MVARLKWASRPGWPGGEGQKSVVKGSGGIRTRQSKRRRVEFTLHRRVDQAMRNGLAGQTIHQGSTTRWRLQRPSEPYAAIHHYCAAKWSIAAPGRHRRFVSSRHSARRNVSITPTQATRRARGRLIPGAWEAQQHDATRRFARAADMLTTRHCGHSPSPRRAHQWQPASWYRVFAPPLASRPLFQAGVCSGTENTVSAPLGFPKI